MGSNMKLLVIGLGGCGGRLADEFARLNQRARRQRRITVIIDLLAINTNTADLRALRNVKSDDQHRIRIGGRKAGIHGVGNISELAAEIARRDADKVINAIRQIPRQAEADAFLLIAGAAGGTGSGSIPVISKSIRERHRDKPLYNLIVLPFEHEERTEERAIYNSATCLKLASEVTDAIFMVDNQRYVRKDASLRNNMDRINARIVEPFYNILCAGEERNVKYIGTRLLNATDITLTLSGWTVISHGRSQPRSAGFPFGLLRLHKEREKESESSKGVEAMEAAVEELSFSCNPKDAGRALYLLTGPGREMNLTLIEKLGDYLKTLAPDAIMRSGDYPRGKGYMDVSIILSQLATIEKVKRYYSEAAKVISTIQKTQT